MKRVAGFQYENRRLLAKWRDSFASAPIGADRGSPPSSWRRQRSSALHLIVRVSHSKDKSRESKCSFGFYGPSGETRLHLRTGMCADRGSARSSPRRRRSFAPHLIFRVSHSKDKSRESECSFGFYGPSGETRTRGILVPKYRQNLYIVYSSFLGGFSLN